MKEKVVIIFIFFIISLCFLLSQNINKKDDNMKNNYTGKKQDESTKKYSSSQIEEIKKSVEAGSMNYAEFEKEFDFECVRETHQGSYVILTSDDKKVFVFINDKLELTKVLVIDEFKTKEEFQLQISDGIPKSEVLMFDTGTILIPVSSVEMTAHLVREGVFIIKYSRIVEGEVIKDPIVSSMLFIENEDLVSNEDEIIQDIVPYIYAEDKSIDVN